MKYVKRTTETVNANDYGIYILKERGVTNVDDYLTPTEKNLYDPLKLDNIVSGAKLLLKHLDNKSKIFILPDCDQDGFASAAILWLYIKDLYPDAALDFDVHEGKEHGITENVINKNYDLFLIPDAGSNQFEEQRAIKDMGKDLIIIDHHLCDEYVNKDIPIINNQMSSEYPNKSLCGSAMCLKFCQVIDSMKGTHYADKYYDLAALGLIGDSMDIKDVETHYIIKRGLENIRNYGLKALIEKQAYSIKDVDNITPTHIAFYIAPLVNAVIRIGKQSEKVTLFNAFINGNEEVQSTKRGAKPGEKETYAVQNARNCVNARARQNRIKDKAIDILEYQISKYNLDENKILFLEIDDPSISTTLTGLIAMQIANKYKKPTLVTRLGTDGIFRGSGRNNDGTEFTDFKNFLDVSGFFDFAEGHANAFGCAIDEKKIESFIDYANNELSSVNFNEGVYEVDFIENSSSDSISKKIIDVCQYSKFWGKGIEEPTFVIENIPINSETFSVIGSNQDTVKISYNGNVYIKFKAQDLIEQIEEGNTYSITVYGKGNLNEWGGEVTPQIFIEDYNLRNTTYDF